MVRRGLRLITLAAIPVLVLSACSSTSATPSATAQQSGGTASKTVRWFVGLGSGTQPSQIADQEAFVDNYNKTNSSGITLKLEIDPNANATDVLKTEFAAGNAPDIIGPVGVKGRNNFSGLLMDLTSLIASNKIDTTQWDPAVYGFDKTSDGQIGLPYDIFPGYIWYDKDLFTAAGLPPLPTTVGATYQGQPWDWNELGTIAAQLATDNKGVHATDVANFDKKNIVTYGIDFQWADARRMASDFGAGNFVASDGKTAQIPAAWADAFNWYYNAMWGTATVAPFAATGAVESSTYLNGGDVQASGHVAMNAAWGWSISSLWSTDSTGKITTGVKTWDMGVVPSWNGVTTAGMDADTFVIAKASKDPADAFTAMLAIEASPKLMQDYGGEPAKASDQAAYFTAFNTTLAAPFPGNTVTWSVLGEMEKHPAVPSIEADMPNLTQASNDYGAFYTKLQNTAGLNVNDELAKLKTTLQSDFDNAIINH